MAENMALNEDWQSKMTIPKCFWHMFEKQIACDVIFEIGPDQERVGAHSLILMGRSSVFFNNFQSGIPEREIEETGLQPEEFTAFLKYLYTGDVNLEGFNVTPIMTLAEKYNVSGLVKFSIDNEFKQMQTDTFGSFVKKFYHTQHMTDIFKSRCLKFVFDHPKQIFEAQGFSLLPLEFIGEIISNEHFVLDEEIVVRRIFTRAEDECKNTLKPVNGENQRKFIDDFFFEIRFAVLSQDFFNDHVTEKDILTSQEELQLMRYLLNPQKALDDKFKFKRNPRQAPKTPYLLAESLTNGNSASGGLTNHFSGQLTSNPSMPIIHATGKEASVKRFSSQGVGWGYRGNKKDAIAFTVSREIRLEYVQVYGNCKENQNMEVTVTVKDSVDRELSVSEVTIPSTVEKAIYDVGVENSLGKYGIDLRANEQYHIILAVKVGDTGFYGKSGLSSTTIEGVDIDFKASKYSTNNTTVMIGQLPGFKFTII